MKQLVAGVITLTVIVVGLLVATSLSSAAQEDDGSGDTTTTTTLADDSGFSGRFGFRFDGELPPELADLEACLTEQGIEIPDGLDRGFLFDLEAEDIDGLADALEACGFPALGDGFPFMGESPFKGRFPFGGDLPPALADLEACLTEQGIEIPEELDRGSLFDLTEEGIEGLTEALETCGVAAFGDEFSFDGEHFKGFPFGGELPDGFPFEGELPEGFPFGGEGFSFHFGAPALDLDELATCLADLGSFDSVDQVREQLEQCLPAAGGLGDLEGFDGHHRGHGFSFGPHGPFGFDLDDGDVDVEGTST
ncbi:MAG: hypothetical protein HKO63_01985 [Acidimicrobiia bacterium]|nr:hypothetical protein [Acidimicrobiia bacterium]